MKCQSLEWAGKINKSRGVNLLPANYKIMNRIEKVIEENQDGFGDGAKSIIRACDKKLLKAVIEEIEERKEYIEKLMPKNNDFRKTILKEDDKIINLIKESIK